MDFNALQHKLFALDPSDPAEDLRKLAESAGDMPQESAPITESLVQESVEVQQGTMPVEGDYSLSDFAALAGVTLNEDWKDDAKRGWNNYNSTSAIGLGKDDIAKAAGFGPGGKKDNKQKPADKVTKTKYPAATNDWKEFLKQHTAQLQKISADPKKKKQFDNFMSTIDEAVEEETKSDKNKRHHKDLDDLERTIRKSPAGMDKDTQSHIDKRRKELTLNNEESKGLYYNVNKRKKAGTSRKQGHPKAPTAQAWKDAAKTAKKESVESIKEMLYRKLNDKK
jgi:hypothetical protein